MIFLSSSSKWYLSKKQTIERKQKEEKKREAYRTYPAGKDERVKNISHGHKGPPISVPFDQKKYIQQYRADRKNNPLLALKNAGQIYRCCNSFPQITPHRHRKKEEKKKRYQKLCLLHNTTLTTPFIPPLPTLLRQPLHPTNTSRPQTLNRRAERESAL